MGLIVVASAYLSRCFAETHSQFLANHYRLKNKHPENNFIKDKIRQQLQNLRDKGFIEFTSRGNYKKIL